MILDTIVAAKKEEVARLRSHGIRLPEEFEEVAVPGPRGFTRAVRSCSGVAIIAEVKKASPSKGVIAHDFDPIRIAAGYQAGGAQAISVLTDRQFFQGSSAYLMQVRSNVMLPVLRKDFIIDQLQVAEAVAIGADAILLIAAILDPFQLRDFREQAQEQGVDCLVEVHDEEEVEAALTSGADLIGVNNRDLRDFTVDIGTTLRLRKLIPAEIPVVSESGLGRPEDIRELEQHGVQAALIGESLMRAGVSSTLLKSLRPA